MTQIVFYTNPFSRGRMVRWMLEECGADYQTVPVQYGAEMKSADYLAVNPMSKSPALKYGDTVITETAAILTFLAEQFPDKNLIPAQGTAERGEFYRWLFFFHPRRIRHHGSMVSGARKRRAQQSHRLRQFPANFAHTGKLTDHTQVCRRRSFHRAGSVFKRPDRLGH